MDRWSGVLKVPLEANSKNHYRVAASLCISHESKSLVVPSANAIFFNGDRVQGTGDPLIERLSNLQNIAEILVSKLGSSINAWVIEASIFNGPFALFKDFIPSINQWGEPKSYSPIGFPASTSSSSLLSNFIKEATIAISRSQKQPYSGGTSASRVYQPKTLIFGFSKGGIVLNQLVAELSFLEATNKGGGPNESQIVPSTNESLLTSIAEFHYVDVGLNSSGAYITDNKVIKKISNRLVQGGRAIRFVLHGTPRQWCDSQRDWIRKEKDTLVQLLDTESQEISERLKVCERLYFSDRLPSMQMHFEIIEEMNLS